MNIVYIVWLLIKIVNNNNKLEYLQPMEAGRQRNLETKMKGIVNDKHKCTDIFLPRKCDYTDRVITSKDYSSVRISICDVKEDGTIDLSKSNLVTLCGYVRGTGQSDTALDKVMREKKLIWYVYDLYFVYNQTLSITNWVIH